MYHHHHHLIKAVVSGILLGHLVLSSSIPKQTGHSQNQGALVRKNELPTQQNEPPTQQTQTVPAYTPIVTPAPDQDRILSSMGYYQTTFYTCNTYPGGQEHCGWHVPVLKAEGARTETGVVVMFVACFAGFFAMGLM